MDTLLGCPFLTVTAPAQTLALARGHDRRTARVWRLITLAVGVTDTAGANAVTALCP